MSKPHISGSYQIRDSTHWKYDTPLFSKWTVGWVEPAGCGHKMCGHDYITEEFATWEDALNFALSLTND